MTTNLNTDPKIQTEQPQAWKRFKYPQSLYYYASASFAIIFIFSSIVYLNIPMERFLGMFGRISNFVVSRYYPPELSYIMDPDYIGSVFDTLKMGFLGAFFGTFKWAIFLSVALFFLEKLNTWITIINTEMIESSILYEPITELGEYLFSWGSEFSKEVPRDLI